MAAPPEVVLVGGDDASGLASMLADLLADNLRDFPGRARVAARARGAVVLRAADHDLDVTVSFLAGRVEIRDGSTEGMTVVAGDWLTMAQLCSGQVSAVAAMRRRDLELRPGRRLPAAAAAGYVLSVPSSFYEQADGASSADGSITAGGSDRRRLLLIGALVAVGAAGAAAVLVRRRATR